ncbi:cbb3-type cytochrome oxidase assembly protein CcoS [Desulfuromonas sp. TF]|uniref:cbb3-type cytochrome oxidase assembly protein CcoS n=1 Tax=Desulfuromonas sp. TF TaxID=1232410 RepID=UPI00042120EC|nr:cbb3-type cytochrome oxidase assembly protein CcoS [Desulfuromonas sp. TF]
MLTSTIILIILSLFLGTGVWLFFIWAVKKGEFDDMEGPKHRMLEDDPADPAKETKDDEKFDQP